MVWKHIQRIHSWKLLTLEGKGEEKKKKKEAKTQGLLLLEILCIIIAEKQKLSLHSS